MSPNRADKIKRAVQLRRQDLTLKVIAARLGVSEGEASRLVKEAAASAAPSNTIGETGFVGWQTHS